MSIVQSACRKVVFTACDLLFSPARRAPGQRAVAVGRQVPVACMQIGIFMSCVAVAGVPALARALMALVWS